MTNFANNLLDQLEDIDDDILNIYNVTNLAERLVIGRINQDANHDVNNQNINHNINRKRAQKKRSETKVICQKHQWTGTWHQYKIRNACPICNLAKTNSIMTLNIIHVTKQLHGITLG